MRLPILFSLALLCPAAIGQSVPSDPGSLVRKAMSQNVLTTAGSAPFHAVLDIESDPKTPGLQQGRIELFWAAPQRYELTVNSPEFTQHLVVDGARVSEENHGDYYPAWLHYMVLALFNPVDRAEEVLGHPNAFNDNPAYADTCYTWDSRRNIVTEAERGADICFSKPLYQLAFTRDYKRMLFLSDFEPFHDKQIARQYKTGLRTGPVPVGRLSVLEDWKADGDRLRVDSPTTTGRILFGTRSPAETTASIVSAPLNVKWPLTRQGAMAGKVLVHVVADRNGKVRETAAPESDNEQLKPFAAELAKQYTFQPLLVNGEPVQAEMPLLINFQLKEQKPYRVFNDAETRSMVRGCVLPARIHDPASAGKTIAIQLLVVEDGRIAQIGSSDRQLGPLDLLRQFHDCHFQPYLEDGKPTPFRASFDVLAK